MAPFARSRPPLPPGRGRARSGGALALPRPQEDDQRRRPHHTSAQKADISPQPSAEGSAHPPASAREKTGSPDAVITMSGR
ncbi:hypothetical protein LZ198_15175 [Myxococcus sp. K15C18031901]|uniref:hypothetical protein n=1 Tax=Myxococcus dinghuensis TaxID=2906761 RepID=UPI0020A77B37|nr:hypothetical protein [Myxococcus dinghuensis]MCP3100213.1 hypothetical protein [Myxococcus dinghuensis]